VGYVRIRSILLPLESGPVPGPDNDAGPEPPS
jgi:hypothetical protein